MHMSLYCKIVPTQADAKMMWKWENSCTLKLTLNLQIFSNILGIYYIVLQAHWKSTEISLYVHIHCTVHNDAITSCMDTLVLYKSLMDGH
jgi:hypothetical protein